MAEDVMKEVDKLLKDREKFEGWLARLESEKSASSKQAYDRVRGDYDKRLQEILGKLRTHAQALEQRISSLQNSLGELEGDHSDRKEKLDEARLRRSVGEFEDEKEWSKLEARLKSHLEETEGQLASTNKEIGRLKEIVAQVSVAEPAAAEPEPEPGPEPEQAKSPAAEPEVEPAPTAVAAPADEGHVSLGELVLEDEDFSGLDLEPAAAAKPEPAKAEPGAAEPEASGGDVGDELAFLESLSLGSGETAESFSFLEDRGTSGTPQTIICPHCSAANDPAEWYCTECGEELPAE